jgi:D-hydroxyproline dehydrogenase
MTRQKTAQVIGGGIIGLNVAVALQEKGFSVTILEPDITQRSASWGNAGHIATEQVEPLASWKNLRSLPNRLFSRGGAASFPANAITDWLPFGLRLMASATPSRFANGTRALSTLLTEALPAWQRRVTSLKRPELLRQTGHIIVWESEKTARQGRAAWARAEIGTASWIDLPEETLCTLQSFLKSPIAGGIQFTGTAQISDPGDMLAAIRDHFADQGGTIETRKAEGDVLSNADINVVCAGVGSAALMRQQGYHVPLIAERGYHIQTPDQNWGYDFPPIVFEDRSIVLTQFRSALRATSFVEYASNDTPPDDKKWERLKQHCQTLGLPFGNNPEQWMGARPTLPDYLPAIGVSKSSPTLLYAFGHQHLGLTLGALTGELIASLATGEAPIVDIAPFSLARF